MVLLRPFAHDSHLVHLFQSIVSNPIIHPFYSDICSNIGTVKKYFEKEKVEYTLGFVYFEKSCTFMIGYSVMDRETKYIEIQKSKVDSLFWEEMPKEKPGPNLDTYVPERPF